MLKKRLATGFLAAALTMGLAVVPAQAAIFSDVSASAWYASDVYDVQAYGILEGTGNGCFSPDNTLTLAQAITMAARTDAYQQGKTIEADGASPWYLPYVTYAAERGICAKDEFGTNYNDFCSRKVMAELFARVFPKSTEDNRNVVEVLPDVENTEENAAIFYLYRQGVLTGSDAQGTFYPDAAIKRSETAAILNRVLDPDKRKNVDFKAPQTNKDIYDQAMTVFMDNYGDELAKVDSEVGTAFVDVNNDGVDELLIGFMNDSTNIISMYTIQGGQAINLFLGVVPDGGDYWENHTLAGDSIICHQWVKDGGTTYGADYCDIDMMNQSLSVLESYAVENSGTPGHINWYSTVSSSLLYGDSTFTQVSDEFLGEIVSQYTPMSVNYEIYAYG